MIIDFGTKMIESSIITSLELTKDPSTCIFIRLADVDSPLIVEYSSEEECIAVYKLIKSCFQPLKVTEPSYMR